MACSNCKMPFLRTTSPRPIYCIYCDRSTQLIPRIQFKVMVTDHSGSTIASISDQSAEKILNLTVQEIYNVSHAKRKALLLDNVHRQFRAKTFRIQMKRLFFKNLDKLAILNYEEKESANQPLPTAPMMDIAEASKRKVMEIGSEPRNQQNLLPKTDLPAVNRKSKSGPLSKGTERC